MMTVTQFKNLKEGTEQEIFNTVALHLLKQNRRATKEDNPESCQYQGKDNTQCAVGCLIPKKYYRSTYETQSINGLIDNPKGLGMPEPLHEFLDKNQELLRALQRLHDGQPPKNWLNALKNLAIEKGLTMTYTEENLPNY